MWFESRHGAGSANDRQYVMWLLAGILVSVLAMFALALCLPYAGSLMYSVLETITPPRMHSAHAA